MGVSESRNVQEWKVELVEDGDSIIVSGTPPGESELKLRVIRMKYIDALETYPSRLTSDYPGQSYIFPNGQDSYRLPGEQWGRIATERLRAMINGRNVNIEFSGADDYHRHLGVVYLGTENVHNRLLRESLVFASLDHRVGNAQAETNLGYWQLYLDARTAGRGVHNSTARPIRGHFWEDHPQAATWTGEISQIMKPWDWRRVHSPTEQDGWKQILFARPKPGAGRNWAEEDIDPGVRTE